MTNQGPRGKKETWTPEELFGDYDLDPSLSLKVEDRDGRLVPRVEYKPAPNRREITAEEVLNIGKNILAEEFIGHYDPETGEYKHDPVLHGLTNLEVMWRKAVDHATAGDLGAFNQILDRILGKPKQTTQNLNVTATFEDFLAEINGNSASRPEDLDDLFEE